MQKTFACRWSESRRRSWGAVESGQRSGAASRHYQCVTLYVPLPPFPHHAVRRFPGHEHARRDWAGSEGEPATQVGIERGLIAGGNPSDDLAHKAGFDGGQLGFDCAGHVQAGGLLVGQRELGMAEPGGDGDNEQVAGKSAEPDDDGGPDLVAAQVRKRNGQGHHIVT